MRKKTLKLAARVPPARSGPLRQRRRLIDACISALHIYGPSRTTVAKVVAIAKMSPGIVRFYFDSKAAMLVASLQFLATEFEEQLLVPVAKLKSSPVAALELMVDLYLDPEIASPRKVSVWYAFWGEASSRQEYYDICGQKDESFAALVRELVERLITETSRPHLDPDGVALGLIGVLEILWQDFAFQTEKNIDRARAKERCMAYLRSIFPGQFPSPAARANQAISASDAALPNTGWLYDDAHIHAMERAQLFQHDWSVIGHESQIPRPGEFLTIDIGTERVLTVRDESGAMHALRNSCPASPHTLVASRSGRFEAGIECKLHRLRFSLDGRGCPGPARADLGVLELSSVGGLMFARAPGVTRVDGEIQNPGPWFDSDPPLGLMMLGSPTEIAVAADWKVIVEQWLESAPQDPGPRAAAASFVWHVSMLDDPGWSGRLYARLVDCTPQRNWRRQFIAPNQLLEARPDGLAVVQAIPIAPGRTLLRRLDYTVLPPDEGARAVLYLARRLGPYARRATLDVAESIQQGLVGFGYETAGAAKSAAVAWFRHHLSARIPALALERPPTESEFNILTQRFEH
ncbi:MAG: family N-acetyltransferase [Gammaproteobacteria bacterium]|nr:family N-acetyltransferase [Gammaproteobacteria bacterium]